MPKKVSLFKPETWAEDDADESPVFVPQGQGLVDPTDVSHRFAFWLWKNVEDIKAVHVQAATGLSEGMVEKIRKSRVFKKAGMTGVDFDLLGANKAKLATGMVIEKLLQRVHRESDGMTTGELLKIIETLGDRVGFSKQTTQVHEFALVDGAAIKKIKASSQEHDQGEFDQAEDIASIAERQQKAIAAGRSGQKRLSEARD